MRSRSPTSALLAVQPAGVEQPLCRSRIKLRVLIAETDQLVAMDLSATVEELGGQVVGIAQTGEQTIALAVRERPDLAVIDVLLDGDIDGVDAALDVQAEHDMPIVFVAGRADAATAERVQLASDQPAVLKPVSLARLRDAIINACALSLGG